MARACAVLLIVRKALTELAPPYLTEMLAVCIQVPEESGWLYWLVISNHRTQTYKIAIVDADLDL